MASAGAYVEVAGEVLMDRRLPADLAARVIAALDKHHAIYVLEAPEALYVQRSVEEGLRAIIEAHFSVGSHGKPTGSDAILESLAVLSQDRESFAKVSVFDARVPVKIIADQIGEGIAVVENSIANEGRHFGELYRQGISKADGIHIAIGALGIEVADTIAFGDGENDVEMIGMAGIGVAIEGSHPGLLALADRTTPPPDQDGIASAFAELGLI